MATSGIAVFSRALDRLGAAISQQQPAAEAKFVAFRVAAEIIVLVENQNSRALPGFFATEVRGGWPAEATSHNNKVMVFCSAEGPRDMAFHAQVLDSSSIRVAFPNASEMVSRALSRNLATGSFPFAKGTAFRAMR